jgi:DNA invertase Pin-like site-specific DNA recombinase
VIIGYGRVSTRDQNPDGQRDALSAAGCRRIYIDHASGKLARRPELDAMVAALRPGDQVVITKLDRLGRSTPNLIELATTFREGDVDLRILDLGVDTSTAVGRMFYEILAAFASFERELMVERTLEGLAAARKRGKVGGRPPKLTAGQVRALCAMYDEVDERGDPVWTVAKLAADFGIHPNTVYNYLNRDTARAKR